MTTKWDRPLLPKSWTPQETERLLAMRADGKSHSECAGHFKVTTKAVSSKLDKLRKETGKGN